MASGKCLKSRFDEADNILRNVRMYETIEITVNNRRRDNKKLRSIGSTAKYAFMKFHVPSRSSYLVRLISFHLASDVFHLFYTPAIHLCNNVTAQLR